MRTILLGLCIALTGCLAESVDEDVFDAAPCVTSTCANGRIDFGETDIDCGGSCAPCMVGRACAKDSDCIGNECIPTVVHYPHATGECWEDTYSGCARVNVTLAENATYCGVGVLAVCQEAANSQMLLHCDAPAGNPAQWDANVLCCSPDLF